MLTWTLSMLWLVTSQTTGACAVDLRVVDGGGAPLEATVAWTRSAGEPQKILCSGEGASVLWDRIGQAVWVEAAGPAYRLEIPLEDRAAAQVEIRLDAGAASFEVRPQRLPGAHRLGPAGAGFGVPANDDCDTAAVLSVPDFVSSSTFGATLKDQTPCGQDVTAPGVWYSLTGTGTVVNASLCGSLPGFNTRLSVYCGTCDDLLCVGSNDDSCGELSEIEWCAELGRTYYLFVHGFGGEQGDFDLALTDTGAPCTAPGACEGQGACCFGMFDCVVTTAAECSLLGGTYLGDGTSCETYVYSAASCSEAFEDIAGIGTELQLGDDDGELVPIGFIFQFFGGYHTAIGVSSNGYLSFGGDLTAFANAPLPSVGEPDALICPLWDDLDPSSGGTVHFATLGIAPHRRFIAQWTGVPQFGQGDANTFQAVLLELGYRIEFRYAAVTPEAQPGDYSIGIEDEQGFKGLQLDGTTAADGACARVNVGFFDTCLGDECWLVIGGGNEGGAFEAPPHTFGAIQVSDVFASFSVTMADVPAIPVPRAAAAARMRLRQTFGEPLEPAFYAQVLMWNPTDFPGNPEQQSAGLAVYALPDGTVYGLPYGQADGGVYFLPLSTFDVEGVPHVRLPFAIQGF